ncbi:CPBP family intramembrane glutamic endopeptidase [Halobacillus litoralis]|uniref:CPBP family intramembrane glutamic endopeptidase n=1 Tax=Halobacillus litoralis TaxID=45668 RepID=UPI0013E8CB50|nr:type II CAAX endopeptidase family protein [Halobacillus litoralis]
MRKEIYLSVFQYVLFLLLYITIDGILNSMFSVSSEFYPYRDYSYILEFIGIVVILCILPTIRNHIKSTLKLSVLKGASTYIWLFLSLIMLFICREFIFFLDFLFDEHFLALYEFGQRDETPVYLISVILFVPIYEEIIYRGIIQHGLTKRLGSLMGIILSSLLFGVIHGDYLVFGFIMGVAFGVVYHCKKSLFVSILLHILWNIIASF